jgi:hypothetical protein
LAYKVLQPRQVDAPAHGNTMDSDSEAKMKPLWLRQTQQQ